MSTRATYEFIDRYNSFTVYKHFDGYPSGALEWIEKALEYAWPLPRFEASEFAAAFVRANKSEAGNVYFSKGKDSHSDTEYHYIISCEENKIYVEIIDFYDNSKIEGFLEDLLHEFGKTD